MGPPRPRGRSRSTGTWLRPQGWTTDGRTAEDGRTFHLLSVIVPVYNERVTVAEVIRRIRAVDVPVDVEVIVVDDCSSDGTDKVLSALGDSTVRILRHDVNQGKGAAIRTGMASARGDLLLIQDADLEYDPEDWPSLLNPILRGKAQVVYGSRFTGQRKNMMPLHWMGNRFLSLVTNVLYSSTMSDMETCYKLFDRRVLEGITIESDKFDFEPEITAKVLRRGYRIYEVPISYAGREISEGKKITWRDGLGALRRPHQVPVHADRAVSGGAGGRTAAVVVNYESGDALARCVGDLAACGPGRTGGGGQRVDRRLARPGARPRAGASRSWTPGRTSGTAPPPTGGWPPASSELVLVCNPDLEVPRDAVDTLAAALDADPGCALVGPLIRTPAGDRYPSARRFPSMVDAAGHALLGIFVPDNRFTRNYQRTELEVASGAPWPSTGCRAPASSSGAPRSSRSGASTSRTSCTPRTSTCAGAWADRDFGWPTCPPPRSPTSRDAPPTVIRTG